MRVAFISRNTLFSGKGGDTVQIVETARYLGKLGVRVDIYKSSDPIDYGVYDIVHGFNVIRPADLISHFENFKKIKVLSTIYVDYSEYEKRARGGLAGFVFRHIDSDLIEYLKAVVRRFVNGEKSFNRKYLLSGHRNTLKRLLKLSDVLLPNSESEYKRLLARYKIPRPYRVVPNAVDPDLFGHFDLAKKKQENLVISVARIDGRKNQLNLIRALNNTRFELILIGKSSPNHSGYYDMCRKEAGPNVKFVQEMEQKELLGYYERAKVHAMPSWFETTGLSTLEGVSMGCNVVITDKGDTFEYFGNDAYYCDPDNIESIRNAVEKAASSDFDPKFREKVMREYNWQRTAEETLAAYKECLSKAAV